MVWYGLRRLILLNRMIKGPPSFIALQPNTPCACCPIISRNLNHASELWPLHSTSDSRVKDAHVVVGTDDEYAAVDVDNAPCDGVEVDDVPSPPAESAS